MRLRCNMAAGSSGGGLMIANGTALNGVISYAKPPRFDFRFSPYFGRVVETFYAQLAGG
jgi:hypothetical protein